VAARSYSCGAQYRQRQYVCVEKWEKRVGLRQRSSMGSCSSLLFHPYCVSRSSTGEGRRMKSSLFLIIARRFLAASKCFHYCVLQLGNRAGPFLSAVHQTLQGLASTTKQKGSCISQGKWISLVWIHSLLRANDPVNSNKWWKPEYAVLPEKHESWSLQSLNSVVQPANHYRQSPILHYNIRKSSTRGLARQSTACEPSSHKWPSTSLA